MTVSCPAALPSLTLPESLNYIGVFLTFGCNLDCAYCINDPRQAGERKAMIAPGHTEMPPDLWHKALRRIPSLPDLPITLQGGEPTLYWRGRGLGQLVAPLDHSFDLLTNLALPTDRMTLCLDGQMAKLQRKAPYPSIRVSFHPEEMDRTWGDGLETLIRRCEALAEIGFTVTPEKATSDVGIYMVRHPDNEALLDKARAATAGRVPFEPKEFLGCHDGRLYGTYRYPYSTDLIERGIASRPLRADCRTTELLIDPLGFVWPCHLYLYETWMQGAPRAAFERLQARGFAFDEEVAALLPYRPVGHILDAAFTLDQLSVFHPCDQYGRCIGCDTKVKNNRFQSMDDWDQPHTSVEIRNIEMPDGIAATLDEGLMETLRGAGVVRSGGKTGGEKA